VVSGAGQSFWTWNHSSSSETVAEGIPKRDTGRRFRSDPQCERPARRPSRAWFGRGASTEVLAGQTPAFAIGKRKYRPSAGRSARQWKAAVVENQLHRPTGHTWPEVICCLSGRGFRVSRWSAPMQTTQYADLQHFSTLYSSVNDRAAAALFAARKRHSASVQTTELAYLQALQETGATGLEPATSGVTVPRRGLPWALAGLRWSHVARLLRSLPCRRSPWVATAAFHERSRTLKTRSSRSTCRSACRRTSPRRRRRRELGPADQCPVSRAQDSQVTVPGPRSFIG
jgi:hypothetical protein